MEAEQEIKEPEEEFLSEKLLEDDLELTPELEELPI